MFDFAGDYFLYFTDRCDLDCVHGDVDNATCTCICVGLWSGPNCGRFAVPIILSTVDSGVVPNM